MSRRCADAEFISLQALPAFATLLPEPRLRPALLQGLAMGLGGLDAQLTAACATALSSTLTRTSAAEPRVGILSESGSGNLSATSSGPQVQVQQEAAAERMLDTWHQQPVQTPQRGDGSSSSSSGSVTASNSLLRAVVGDLPLLWQQTERYMSPIACCIRGVAHQLQQIQNPCAEKQPGAGALRKVGEGFLQLVSL